MFVLVKRNPEKAITGITGGGVLIDGNGKEMVCSWCDDQPATRSFDYFDPDNCTLLARDNQPFQEVVCESCDESSRDGYFYCEGCEEQHIENYSWELFYVATDDGVYCLACNKKRIALDFPSYVITLEDLETDGWRSKVVRLGGHQRPISPRFKVMREFDGVDDADDAPTPMSEIVSTVRELLEGGETVAVAVTNAYQFCQDMAIVKLAGDK